MFNNMCQTLLIIIFHAGTGLYNQTKLNTVFWLLVFTNKI